jgi:hypothetical protein
MLPGRAGECGDMPELLIDSMPVTFSLEEDKQTPGKYILRGQFAKAGVATDNKRIYREHLWKREFGKLAEAMQSRRVYGELDHPADGRTKLQRVSHLITDLRVEGNEVIGAAEILDTPNGRIAKALAKANAQMGVSSRGYGSTKMLPDGTQEVQEDFALHTFDLVADPATKTAYPQVFAEERQFIQEAEVELTLERLKQHYPGLVKELTEQILEGKNGGDSVTRAIMEAEQRTEERLTQRFAEKLRRGVEVIEEEARASVRSELMSDPAVAGAKQVLEQIVGLVRSYGIDSQARDQLSAKDEEIEKLKKELADRELEVQRYRAEGSEMKKLAKEAAYTLHLERQVPEKSRQAVLSLLGDLTKFESKEELDARLRTIMQEMDRRLGPPRETEGEENGGDSPNEELRGKVEELEQRVSDLTERLETETRAKKSSFDRAERAEASARKAVDLAEELELQLYVEQQIGSFPGKDRETLRSLCEHAVAREEVDQVIKKFTPQRRLDDDEANRVRARVQRGKGRDLYEDTHGQKGGPGNGKGSSPLEEIGLKTGDFNKLAGTGKGA